MKKIKIVALLVFSALIIALSSCAAAGEGKFEVTVTADPGTYYFVATTEKVTDGKGKDNKIVDAPEGSKDFSVVVETDDTSGKKEVEVDADTDYYFYRVDGEKVELMEDKAYTVGVDKTAPVAITIN